MSSAYKVDFTAAHIVHPWPRGFCDPGKACKPCLMGPDIHPTAVQNALEGEEELWTIFTRVSPTYWQNNCIPEFEASRDALQRALTQPDSLPDAYARLARVYDEAFHPNYTDLLLPPSCAHCGVAYVNGYQQMSSVFDVTEANLFRASELMDGLRNRMVYAGVFNRSQNHYVGWIVAFPRNPDTEGVILVLDPFGARDNPECVERLRHIATFLAHLKLSEHACKLTERRAPRMRVVHVSHPPDLTQTDDLCCNFWATILVTAWISYYRLKCHMNAEVFAQRLRRMFPGDRGAYDFRDLSFMSSVDKEYRLTMASLRTYTLLFMQCLFQLADVAHACQCLNLTEHEKYHGTVVHASLPEAKQILDRLCRKLGAEESYVLAGSAEALQHYKNLVARWESVKLDLTGRDKLIKSLPSIDLFRIFLSRFDDKSNSSVNNVIVSNMMVLNKYSKSTGFIIQPMANLSACGYVCEPEPAYDPAAIRRFTESRSAGGAAAFAPRPRPESPSIDPDIVIDLAGD